MHPLSVSIEKVSRTPSLPSAARSCVMQGYATKKILLFLGNLQFSTGFPRKKSFFGDALKNFAGIYAFFSDFAVDFLAIPHYHICATKIDKFFLKAIPAFLMNFSVSRNFPVKTASFLSLLAHKKYQPEIPARFLGGSYYGFQGSDSEAYGRLRS